MNQLLDEDVYRIVESVWSMILGLDIGRAPPTAFPPGARTLSASVQISGAWDGVVHLQCAATLAQRAAGIMFGIDPRTAKADQIQDALGELTNMVGGNVKALLPEPCRLSLPTLVDGTGYEVRVPGRTKPVSRLALACGGEPFMLSVLRREETTTVRQVR